MTEPERNPTGDERTAVADDQLGALLRAAGRRPGAPREVATRVRRTVHIEWRRTLRARRRRAWTWTLGSVAAAVAAVLIGTTLLQRPAPVPVAVPRPVATVEVLVGEVTQRLEAEGRPPEERPLAIGDVIPAGATLTSSTLGGASLRLLSGSSLRLGTATSLRFEAPERLTLADGRVYVDSGDDGGATRAVEIGTPLGRVREIGTQFEVRSAGDDMRVRVREGAVVVRHGSESHEAGAGGELTVGRDGSTRRSEISAYDEEWGWVLELAPRFELEGARLGGFLEWVGRETGRQVRFRPPLDREQTASIVLHGSVAGLRPDEALAAVLATCDLDYRLDAGTLEIDAARAVR